jgi:hypothetical protein
MKKLVLPLTLLMLLTLAFVFWLPHEELGVRVAPVIPVLAPPVASAPVLAPIPSSAVTTDRKEVVARQFSNQDVPASALDDIGGEVLSDEELAGIETIEKQLNQVRERWADHRQKIYHRLNVTPQEEKQLAEAADTFEGEFQVVAQGKGSVSEEINQELDDATQRFDQRTVQILGIERFNALVEERDKFNEQLRAEGVGSHVGSFW